MSIDLNSAGNKINETLKELINLEVTDKQMMTVEPKTEEELEAEQEALEDKGYTGEILPYKFGIGSIPEGGDEVIFEGQKNSVVFYDGEGSIKEHDFFCNTNVDINYNFRDYGASYQDDTTYNEYRIGNNYIDKASDTNSPSNWRTVLTNSANKQNKTLRNKRATTRKTAGYAHRLALHSSAEVAFSGDSYVDVQDFARLTLNGDAHVDITGPREYANGKKIEEYSIGEYTQDATCAPNIRIHDRVLVELDNSGAPEISSQIFNHWFELRDIIEEYKNNTRTEEQKAQENYTEIKNEYNEYTQRIQKVYSSYWMYTDEDSFNTPEYNLFSTYFIESSTFPYTYSFKPFYKANNTLKTQAELISEFIAMAKHRFRNTIRIRGKSTFNIESGTYKYFSDDYGPIPYKQNTYGFGSHKTGRFGPSFDMKNNAWFEMDQNGGLHITGNSGLDMDAHAYMKVCGFDKKDDGGSLVIVDGNSCFRMYGDKTWGSPSVTMQGPSQVVINGDTDEAEFKPQILINPQQIIIEGQGAKGIPYQKSTPSNVDGLITYINRADIGRLTSPSYQQSSPRVLIQNGTKLHVGGYGCTNILVQPVTDGFFSAFLSGNNTFIETSGYTHFEAHDGSTVVMRGPLNGKKPWQDKVSNNNWKRPMNLGYTTDTEASTIIDSSLYIPISISSSSNALPDEDLYFNQEMTKPFSRCFVTYQDLVKAQGSSKIIENLTTNEVSNPTNFVTAIKERINSTKTDQAYVGGKRTWETEVTYKNNTGKITYVDRYSRTTDIKLYSASYPNGRNYKFNTHKIKMTFDAYSSYNKIDWSNDYTRLGFTYNPSTRPIQPSVEDFSHTKKGPLVGLYDAPVVTIRGNWDLEDNDINNPKPEGWEASIPRQDDDNPLIEIIGKSTVQLDNSEIIMGGGTKISANETGFTFSNGTDNVTFTIEQLQSLLSLVNT